MLRPVVGAVELVCRITEPATLLNKPVKLDASDRRESHGCTDLADGRIFPGFSVDEELAPTPHVR